MSDTGGWCPRCGASVYGPDVHDCSYWVKILPIEEPEPPKQGQFDCPRCGLRVLCYERSHVKCRCDAEYDVHGINELARRV